MRIRIILSFLLLLSSILGFCEFKFDTLDCGPKTGKALLQMQKSIQQQSARTDSINKGVQKLRAQNDSLQKAIDKTDTKGDFYSDLLSSVSNFYLVIISLLLAVIASGIVWVIVIFLKKLKSLEPKFNELEKKADKSNSHLSTAAGNIFSLAAHLSEERGDNLDAMAFFVSAAERQMQGTNILNEKILDAKEKPEEFSTTVNNLENAHRLLLVIVGASANKEKLMASAQEIEENLTDLLKCKDKKVVDLAAEIKTTINKFIT